MIPKAKDYKQYLEFNNGRYLKGAQRIRNLSCINSKWRTMRCSQKVRTFKHISTNTGCWQNGCVTNMGGRLTGRFRKRLERKGTTRRINSTVQQTPNVDRRFSNIAELDDFDMKTCLQTHHLIPTIKSLTGQTYRLLLVLEVCCSESGCVDDGGFFHYKVK